MHPPPPTHTNADLSHRENKESAATRKHQYATQVDATLARFNSKQSKLKPWNYGGPLAEQKRPLHPYSLPSLLFSVPVYTQW